MRVPEISPVPFSRLGRKEDLSPIKSVSVKNNIKRITLSSEYHLVTVSPYYTDGGRNALFEKGDCRIHSVACRPDVSKVGFWR